MAMGTRRQRQRQEELWYRCDWREFRGILAEPHRGRRKWAGL